MFGLSGACFIPQVLVLMGDEKLHLFGEFVLDTARGTLLRAGQPVHLRPQAYTTLKYLVENRGRLISKDRLIEEVWEGRAVTDDSLVQCLRDVRQALGEGSNQYLRNERGRGYIFDPETDGRSMLQDNAAWTEHVDLLRVVVEEDEESELARRIGEPTSRPAALSAVAAARLPAGHAATGTENVLSKIMRHKRAALVAVAVLAVCAVGVVYLTRFATRGQTIKSVAVLPFANASGDANLEYLSDGLSESLIDRLSQLPNVKVIARSSSFKYKGQEIDPGEVGKALGVEAVVMGRVVQRGDDLQMRVELVDTRTGTQVWGEQYSRKAADVQAVQKEIARAVSDKLRLRLSGAQEQQLTKHATQNPQAYQAYLNGLFCMRKGGFENVRRALEYYNQAVTLDPSFALAWVGIANAYRDLQAKSLLDPKVALARATAAAQKALELDEMLPNAHSALARIKHDEWDWAGAERGYKRAIDLNPNMAEAHSRYSQYLSATGRTTEALAEGKRAQELDPLQTRGWGALYSARRYDEAIEKLQLAIKLEPDVGVSHGALAVTYDAKGMHEQAINEYQKWISIDGETTSILCYLGHALAMSGKRSEAEAILNKLKTTKEYVSPGELAVLYIGLGDKEGALAMLEKGYERHDPVLTNLKVDPLYDNLRSDPRFQDLVRRVGLPP